MIEKSKAILYHVDISQWYFLVFQFKIMFYFLHELKHRSSTTWRHWTALTASSFRHYWGSANDSKFLYEIQATQGQVLLGKLKGAQHVSCMKNYDFLVAKSKSGHQGPLGSARAVSLGTSASIYRQMAITYYKRFTPLLIVYLLVLLLSQRHWKNLYTLGLVGSDREWIWPWQSPLDKQWPLLPLPLLLTRTLVSAFA